MVKCIVCGTVKQILTVFIVYRLPGERFCSYLLCSRSLERFFRYLSCPGSRERDFVAIYRVRAHFDDIPLSLGSRCCRYLQCSPAGTGWSGQRGWHQMGGCGGSSHEQTRAIEAIGPSELTSGIQQKSMPKHNTSNNGFGPSSWPVLFNKKSMPKHMCFSNESGTRPHGSASQQKKHAKTYVFY